MSRVDKVLDGCNLQAGMLLLLWLFAIFCGFSVIVDICYMSEGVQLWPEDSSWNDFKFTVAFLYKLGVFIVIISGLYGIYRDKPKFFTVFYYFNYFQLLLISIFIVYLYLDPVERGKDFIPETKFVAEDYNRTIILSILVLFGLAFQIYFILVVRTYHETMKQRSSSKTHIIVFAYPEHYDYGLTNVR